LVAAAGPGARPNVAERRGLSGAGREQVNGSFYGGLESRGEPRSGGAGRQPAKGQLLRVLGP
jgi:hypothetical protein